MTPKQFERMAKCDHRKTCGRLVTLKASSYADPYYWCLCDECPYYTTENAKLRELAKRMHRQIKQTCDGCDGYYCSNFDEDNECCVYDTLLRELGVVDA